MSNTVTAKTESRHGEKRTKSMLASRKIRAVLAGGLVLGVGVGVTLASWTDSVASSGTYTAGVLDLEGKKSELLGFAGGLAATTLDYSALVSNLSPSNVVYAPYSVRLSASSTTGADITLSAQTGNVVTGLTYTLVKTSSFACDSGVVSAAILAGDALVTNQPLGYVIPNTVTFPLVKGSPTGSPAVAGTSQNLCFAVTAGNGLVQAQTGTSTISFTATSTS